ncbi:hypothetical protein T492DRAFT_1037290 [Pavlovales sp. CCMP2436]|nr:hypothetical protein T492DRAFT_1037290 [Pavlovales sp. CCMP2436]|mmetsp:Transcript_29978/g.70027  ORF Transcript_29978/g.70027 Transcript_29978/m.70027 type:complete len:193 (+) Transcript_29978:1493-2071(+)
MERTAASELGLLQMSNRPATRSRCRRAPALITLAAVALVSMALIVVVSGKAGPTRRMRGEDPACPGSSALIHASCKLSVHFTNSCSAVQKVLEARMEVGHDCKSKPGTYKGSWKSGSRTTGDGKYTDRFKNSLSPSSDGGCSLTACSESQGTSVIDYSTNFCNLRNLYANSPLAFVEHFDSCSQHDQNACCR